MRFTIPGRDHDLHRAGIRRDRLTRGEAWRIILTADRLHGIGVNTHPRPVHRERVRHGAWEGAPRVVLYNRGGALKPALTWTVSGIDVTGAPIWNALAEEEW